ncbi:hypothetical protein ACQKGD_15205 [Peribacillus frigoritolerans]|uniref:hypothetical protein n=1 Tax=Peribacillus frigoritolerans TaxID=450367 RepID=UPI003D08A052
MNRREQLAYILGLVDYNQNIRILIEKAISFGVTVKMHEGQPPEFFEEDQEKNRTAEWLMGQLMIAELHDSTLDKLNLCGICHSFLQNDYGYNGKGYMREE